MFRDGGVFWNHTEDTKQPPGGLSDQRETGSAYFGMNPKTVHRANDPVKGAKSSFPQFQNGKGETEEKRN